MPTARVPPSRRRRSAAAVSRPPPARRRRPHPTPSTRRATAGWSCPTSRCRRRGWRGLHLRGKADIWSENGYGFAAEEPQEVIGKVFAVERIEPYDPRRLKRSLKGAGAELMKRDFPFGAEELARRLDVHAGADVRLAFTKIGNGFWAVRLK